MWKREHRPRGHESIFSAQTEQGQLAKTLLYTIMCCPVMQSTLTSSHPVPRPPPRRWHRWQQEQKCTRQRTPPGTCTDHNKPWRVAKSRNPPPNVHARVLLRGHGTKSRWQPQDKRYLLLGGDNNLAHRTLHLGCIVVHEVQAHRMAGSGASGLPVQCQAKALPECAGAAHVGRGYISTTINAAHGRACHDARMVTTTHAERCAQAMAP